jgi:hypothetical protein
MKTYFFKWQGTYGSYQDMTSGVVVAPDQDTAQILVMEHLSQVIDPIYDLERVKNQVELVEIPQTAGVVAGTSFTNSWR